MEIIQRYLHAIEFWLPKGQKKDIIAEISEDLHSQMEAQEEHLGRALNDTEIEALLKQRGNPLLVANRYLPQQSLIGPGLFPIYLFVLKIWAICWPLPATVLYFIIQRTQHPDLPWINTIGQAIGWLWTAVFLAVGTITLAFAALERVDAKTHFLEKWNPRKLPPVRDPNKIPRVSSAIEVVANLAFVVVFVSYASSLTIIDSPALHVTLAPVWTYLFWGFLAVALVLTALSIVNLLKPSWTWQRAAVRLGLDLGGGALWCWLMKARIFETFLMTKGHETQGSDIARMINNWTEWTFPYSILVVLIIVGIDLYRMIRLLRKDSARPNPGTIVAMPF